VPQFDFANVFWPQFIWLAILFAVLYFGVVRFTLPKVGRVMAAREDRVSGDISVAEKAKAEADRIHADYESGVAAAQDASRATVNTARSKAQAAIEAKLAASNAALEARGAEAQASLDAARKAAFGQIEGVAADVASDIVERLTGTRPAATDAAKAAQAALA
jgi:F-type H+-transporting ATPase subunit b